MKSEVELINGVNWTVFLPFRAFFVLVKTLGIAI
jgi:hypothetical protein